MAKFLALLFAAAALVTVAAADPAFRVHVSASQSDSMKDVLAQVDHRRVGKVIELFASSDELEQLRRANVAFDIKETAKPFAQKHATMLPVGYQTLAQINAFLEQTVRSYPTLAMLVDSAQYGTGVTYEGRKIPILKISGNVTVDEDEPAILINSNIHAREVVTPVLATEIIRRLTTQYSNDVNVRRIVDNNAIYIMPTINPDGYEYMWNVNNMWRKNRKPNRDSSFGIDCNRNFPLAWDGECTGSSVPASDTYRGPSPASEEETQIVMDFSSTVNLAKLIDFHSSGREVLVGYLCEPMTPALDDYIVSEGEALADKANYGTRRPSSDGEHQEWNIANVTSYSYLVETETEFQPPYADALAEFERIWPLVLHMFDRVIPVSGHVTYGNRPVVASIRVTQLGGDVTWKSEAKFGRYQLFLPNGVWTLTVSADGAPTRTLNVNVNNAVAQRLDIAL